MNIIKKYTYNLLRNRIMRIFTGKLGKVVEEDDKLICYVSKCTSKKGFFSVLGCNGICEDDKHIAKMFNLDKPIYYVLDGLTFDKNQVFVIGYDNANIIMKNCTFAHGLYVSVEGTFLLEDSYAGVDGRLFISACETTIKNIEISNELKDRSDLDIILKASDNLSIIDCQLGSTNERTNIDIFSNKKIIIDNSKISGENINCKSSKIDNCNDSSLFASKNIEINVDNLETTEITSPSIILNGRKINNGTNSMKVTNSVASKKRELIDTLKQIKEIYENEDSFYGEINTKPIIRSLKKDRDLS